MARAQPGVSSPTADPAFRGGRVYLSLGAGFGQPLDGKVREIYPDAWVFSGALGIRTQESWRVEMRIEYLARPGRPAVPPFGIAAESRLVLLPISLGASYLLRTEGRARPFVTVGPTVFRLKETFEYPLLNAGASLPSQRTQWGGFAGVGIEAPRAPLTYRIAVRGFFAPGAFAVARPRGDDLELDGSRAPSLWLASLEVLFP